MVSQMFNSTPRSAVQCLRLRAATMGMTALLAAGCGASAAADQAASAESAQPTTAPTTSPSSRPPTTPVLRPEDLAGSMREPETEVIHSSRPLDKVTSQTVVANGPLPLIYWPVSDVRVRVVNAAGGVVAEGLLPESTILRVDTQGVFAGETRLSRGGLPQGKYQVHVISEGVGEIRSEQLRPKAEPEGQSSPRR